MASFCGRFLTGGGYRKRDAAADDSGLRERRQPDKLLRFVDHKNLGETTVIRELIPYIGGHYRTIASRDRRSIQGMSMGGFGCMKLGLKYPDLFCSTVAFARGFRRPEVIGSG